MSDLHAQLLDRCNHLSDVHRALHAVVELHAPAEDRIGDRLVRLECQGCDVGGWDWEYPTWPCSTIRTIADQLGLTEGTDHRG